MVDERAKPEAGRPLLTALEASLLLLGLSFLLLWATSAGPTVQPNRSVLAWALRMHGMPLFMLGGALVIAWRFGPLVPPLCPDRSARLYAVSAVCLGIAGGLAVGPSSPQALAPVLSPGVALAWGLLWVGLAAPVIEELFYRGVLQSALARETPAFVAVIGSGLAFGLAHIGRPDSALYFVLGGVFAAYRAGSRALLPPALAHVAWNAATVFTSAVELPYGLAVLPGLAGLVALLLGWLNGPPPLEDA